MQVLGTKRSLLLERTEFYDWQALQDLTSEWTRLWRLSGCSPFQSPMWLLPWAERFTNDNLIVLTLRAEGMLVGVAPFYSWNQPDSNNRRLLLLGNGLSDYLDACVDPVFRETVIETLGEWCDAVPDIEEVEWNQIPRTSVLYGLSLKNWWAQVTDANPCLRLELLDEGSFIPHRQLEKLRYYRRRAAKCGEVDFERATADNCSEFLNELFQLHRDRWRTKNGEGVLSDPAVRDFHLAAAQKAASAGALRLYRMKLNRQVITVLYAFAGGKSTYYYLSGFDPAFDKLSPGTLIVGHAIEEAIAEGHRWFDFLRGQESYKYAWGAIENWTKRVIGVKK